MRSKIKEEPIYDCEGLTNMKMQVNQCISLGKKFCYPGLALIVCRACV